MKSAAQRSRERGAGTLVAVMLMFLLMALMAVYANRSLIFEQRIASNYVRSSAALEMADSGIDWAMAQLNGGDINAACSASPGAGSFRQRYMSQDAGTRVISVPISATVASCVHVSSQAWACQCPQPGAWADAALPVQTEPQPSFGIRFEAVSRPGVLRIVSIGCTGSKVSTCSQKNFGAAADQQLGNATVRTEVALLSALKMPPAAPLVLRQALTVGARGVGLHNRDPRGGGMLMISGSAVPNLPAPGSDRLLGNDPALRDASATDAMFRMFFGMPSDKYRNQPAMRQITCTGDCSNAIAEAYATGARMVWVNGPLTLASNLELGSTASPILIVADGPVTLNGPMTINGLLYARGNLSWSNGSSMPALLIGALISEGAVQISGTVDLSYQPAVMDLLSNATGSFVRVPGSWSDISGGS